MSDRTELQQIERARAAFHLAGIGLVVNSALYLLMVFASAVIFGQRAVLVVTIAAAGVTYLSYVAQIAFHNASAPHNLQAYRKAQAATMLSIVLGTLAGLMLAFGLLWR
jgi:arginine exporter protein ArgO